MSVEQLMGEIDDRIAGLIPGEQRTQPFYGMLEYHLGWRDEGLQRVRLDPGKRLRSRLCLLVCEAVGAFPGRALPPATAVELIHNFSLIHDDIQDRSELRRHRRTVWAVWGAAQAINAGDDMFSLAQLALAEDENTDPGVVVRALRSLNRTCRSLCEGQYLDLDYEQRPSVSLNEYFAMIERKTAALIEAACFLGALYGGAEENALQAYARFGRQLGLAFQMQDDYLGIWGDPVKTGKPIASDVASKKKTLPLIYAAGASPGPDGDRLRVILSSPGPASEVEVSEILEILARRGVVEYTAAEVGRFSQGALDLLETARPAPRAGAELASLCQQLTIRTR